MHCYCLINSHVLQFQAINCFTVLAIIFYVCTNIEKMVCYLYPAPLGKKGA
jgi:hypothetical protein